MKRLTSLVVATIAAFLYPATPASAQTPAPSSDSGSGWTYAITPYLWLPNINGQLAFAPPDGGSNPSVKVGPYDWLEHLSGLLMLSGEAHQDKWSVLADVIYLDFSDQRSTVKEANFKLGAAGRVPVAADANVDASSGLRGWLWSAAGAYRLIDSPHYWLDGYGGVRYLQIKASATWQLNSTIALPGSSSSFASNGSVSQSVNIWSAIVGVRGRAGLGSGKWFAPYSIDAGGGSSAFTWQATAGIGYAYDWGDLLLSYRYLAYDMRDGDLLQNIHFNGPAFAATFRF